MNDQKKPVLTFIAGVNGAGKSTYIKAFVKASNGPIVVFNPDIVQKKILEQDPGCKSVGKLILKDLERKLSLKKDMVLETTLAGATVINRVKAAKENGYQVNMVFVSLDKLDTHLKRIAARVGKGGHDIPPNVVERRFRTSYENFKKIAPEVDNLKVYDNTRQMNKVLEVQNGKVKYAGQLNEKLQEIFPGLQKIRNQKPQKLSAVEQLKQRREKQAQTKSLSR